MGTDNWFDTLAKDSAQGLSRRQVFGRLFGGIGLAVLGAVSASARDKNKDCLEACQIFCGNNHSVNGPGYGQCLSACLHGEYPLICSGV